jgi:HNH endonuclease
MDERLRQFVREWAGHRCEYCSLPQDAEPFFAYHIEHIVARQHGGGDDSGNLALACYHCNAHKGSNLSGLDTASTDTGRIAPAATGIVRLPGRQKLAMATKADTESLTDHLLSLRLHSTSRT